jgi:DNA-binding MarR family transcriptional regulator/YHS domain-containing protein
MATDPVCGMAVTVGPDTPITEHAGAVHSFCTRACQRRFDKEPERFLAAGGRSGHPPASAARARELSRLLRRLARRLAEPAYGQAGAGRDLPALEQVVLLEVGERGRAMMSELAEACGMALSTMTGLVDRLEKKGHVRRIRSEEDRRVVHAEMTPRGKRAYQERLEGDMRIVIALLDALSPREQAAVARALGKVAGALEG